MDGVISALPPPPDLRIYRSDTQNTNSVRYTWKIYQGKPNVVDFGFTDDVTGHVKVKRFDDLSCLTLSRTTTASNVNKPAWAVSVTLLSTILWHKTLEKDGSDNFWPSKYKNSAISKTPTRKFVDIYTRKYSYTYIRVFNLKIFFKILQHIFWKIFSQFLTCSKIRKSEMPGSRPFFTLWWEPIISIFKALCITALPANS